jgi:hypothetical protein
MKLRYKGALRGIKDSPLVVTKYGYELWQKDEEKEVDETKGAELLKMYPGRFEEVKGAKKAPEASTKLKSEYKNKAK